MPDQNYDLLIIGGGIAGASLAGAVARQGAKVVVLESETRFKDRVRGEAIMPWGVVDARALGVYDVLVSAGAIPITYWDTYQGAERSGHRNVVDTAPLKEHILDCYHPAMQEALLQWAQDSGASVLRGARARSLTTDGVNLVEIDGNEKSESISARMVVGADGRGSSVRSWAGFSVQKEPDRNLASGLLMENVDLSEDAAHTWLQTDLGYFAFFWPQGNGMARVYFCYGSGPGSLPKLSGAGDIPRFLEGCQAAGVPSEVLSQAKAAGPLATFDGAGAWTEIAFQQGVALIGDAASNSDPTWGQGLSMALRDARVLAQALAEHQDWDVAGNAYSVERNQYRQVIQTIEDWQSTVLMDVGPEADSLRAKVLPSWRSDRSRHPDTFFAGPGATLDEEARRRFFGED